MPIKRYFFSWSLVGALGCLGCSPRCYLKKDTQVDFYPTYVYQEPTGQWTMPVTAWVHENNPDPSLQRSVTRVITLMSLVPGTAEVSLSLQERVTPFLLRGQPTHAVPVTLAAKTIQLGPSDAGGFIEQTVPFPTEAPKSLPATLTYKTQTCRDDSRVFAGEALVIAPTGLSIISDLDTLLDRRLYTADPAMAALYQTWNSSGTAFHYVSASPWQLYAPLSHGLANQGFPKGIVHLNTLPSNFLGDSFDTLIANVVKFFGPATTTKLPAMEAILKNFPTRRFILVGDSRENDQLAFAALARRYPQQVSQIFIRTTERNEEASLARAFSGLPTTLWRPFTDPQELKKAPI